MDAFVLNRLALYAWHYSAGCVGYLRVTPCAIMGGFKSPEA
ncbi:MAG: hypothetical protein AABW54_00070 [Candidatus Micrarchaeota archaeon]